MKKYTLSPPWVQDLVMEIKFTSEPKYKSTSKENMLELKDIGGKFITLNIHIRK